MTRFNMFVAVVPAFNEGKTIGSVVRSLFNHVDKVVVVDDCSADNTFTEAKEAGAEVLHHKINRGQGAALQTGHDYALSLGADYTVDFDADGQHQVEDIIPAKDFLIKSGAEILFGSRFLGKSSKLPLSKKYLLLPLGRLVNWLFGSINLRDAQNGFRIYNKTALQKIIIKQDGMAHATEILTQVRGNGLRYVEFPVQVVYHEYGQGIGSGLKIIRDLFYGIFS